MKKTKHLIVSLVIGIFSSLIANYLSQVNMSWTYKYLIQGVWPWYVGLLIVGIYWIVKFFYDKHLENIRFTNWVLEQSPYYDRKDFNNLEQKMNYLIDKKLEYFEGRLKRGEIK